MIATTKASFTKLKECKAGALVFALLDGEHVVAVVLDRVVEDGDTVSLALLRSETPNPVLRYANTDLACVSYGHDWLVDPKSSTLASSQHMGSKSLPFGAVAISIEGWAIKLEGNRQAAEWWSLSSGSLVGSSIPKAFAYTEWSIWESIEHWNNPRAQALMQV